MVSALGIGALPQEKVAQPAFTTSPDEEIYGGPQCFAQSIERQVLHPAAPVEFHLQQDAVAWPATAVFIIRG
jgi:hypothetical protein